jgi:hypothetical protein
VHRTVAELKKEIAALTATVKEQAAQIITVGRVHVAGGVVIERVITIGRVVVAGFVNLPLQERD